MTAWMVRSGLQLRRLALAAALALLALGVLQLRHARTDVYPEFGATTVRVQAEARGLSAQEVEQLVTVPMEQDLLNGIPWLAHIRSTSMPGLAAIDLEFQPGTDLYRARQMVQERMTQAKALPNVGTPPVMVQPESSTSRVAMVALRSPTVSLMDMSVLARWQIRPRLMSIPGVANVTVWGQRDRQLQVQVDPGRMAAHAVSLTQVIETAGNALWVSPLSFVEASTPGTGGFVETPNQRIGVQHVSPITTSAQLADVAVQGVDGPPVRLRDVAAVVEGSPPQIGDASLDGGQSLVLAVDRFPDADVRQVSRDVGAALAAMAPGLTGITVTPDVLRPVSYLDAALADVGWVALAGLLLMVLVLGLLTRSWRVALLGALTVPLSLVAAAWALSLRGHTLTTTTALGLAAAVLLVLDELVGDVLAVRARRAEQPGEDVTAAVLDVVRARRTPLLAGTLVVAVALSPLLLLHGVARVLTRDVLLTYGLAVLVAVLTALLVLPGLSVALLRGGRAPGRRRGLRWTTWSAGRPLRGALAAVLLLGVALTALPRLHDGPVLPPLQARDAVVRLTAAPGTGLAEMDRVTGAIATELRALPGVASAGAHVGRTTGATEVVDVNAAEIWVSVAPGADPARTLTAVREVVAGYPGLRSAVDTYTGDRLAAAQPLVQQGLTVRVYGNDLGTLRTVADQVRQVVATVPGILAPAVQGGTAQPTLHVEVDLAKARAQGLRPGDVRRETSTLLSGLTVGSLYEQQKVFDVVVQGAPVTQQSIDAVRAIRIDTPSGQQVPLGDVAAVTLGAEPAAVTHDSVSRTLDVTATLAGRSPADAAAEVTSRLRALSLPYEYHAEVLPGAAQQAAAHSRLLAAGAVALLLVLLLLQAATDSWSVAAALLLVLPLAAAGGVAVAPSVGGLRSAGVLTGLVAVVALAVRQSLVLLRRARALRDDGADGRGALAGAVAGSAGPVLVVALAAAAVLLPAAVAGPRAGLEVLQPMAVTVLAGLASLVVVLLGVVPALTPAVQAAPTAAPTPAAPTGPDGQRTGAEVAGATSPLVPQTRRSPETEAFR